MQKIFINHGIYFCRKLTCLWHSMSCLCMASNCHAFAGESAIRSFHPQKHAIAMRANVPNTSWSGIVKFARLSSPMSRLTTQIAPFALNHLFQFVFINLFVNRNWWNICNYTPKAVWALTASCTRMHYNCLSTLNAKMALHPRWMALHAPNMGSSPFTPRSLLQIHENCRKSNNLTSTSTIVVIWVAGSSDLRTRSCCTTSLPPRPTAYAVSWTARQSRNAFKDAKKHQCRKHLLKETRLQKR